MGKEQLQTMVAKLQKKYGEQLEVSENLVNVILTVPVQDLINVMTELKGNPDYKFSMLLDVTAVDYPENFTVVYELTSIEYGVNLRVKTILDKQSPKVPSMVSLWLSANLMERETYDLLGIIFEGHPELIRVLLPDDFVGHPLRKDFKLEA